MIKHKFLLIALLGASILVPVAAVQAQSFSIEIGDRPYYRHGPRYWAGDWEMIWVPGHRSGRRWVHGHYIRGQNRRHINRSNRRRDRFDDRRNDRYDDRRDYREDRGDDRRDRRDDRRDDR